MSSEYEMTIDEYAVIAKKEIDDFVSEWRRNQIMSSNVAWPNSLEEGEWGEQEMASRFQ